ncbi:hypothetical protein [Aquabacterium sp.]|uniref:hypothetical protein n=1 Tax=Aquabacterium sp. TaxID=1872578 RepID=UPI0025B82052|nr:hypothetical protein [Aquabacterium sp.]
MTRFSLAALPASLLASTAWAHEGHGLDGFSHWHPTDAWGFVAMAIVGAALWFGGRK